MAKLWGGRFSKNTNELVDAFNASINYDKRLYREDIRGSIAHANMLVKCGVIPEADGKKIVAGLQDILKDIEDIGICRFTKQDVVRHPLVQRIVEAYERSEHPEPVHGPWDRKEGGSRK